MNEKWVSTILIVIASFTALFFVIKQNFELAVLFLTLMFTFSNFFKSKSFKEQGYDKESKWMKSMAIFFGLCTIVIFIIIIK